MTVFVLENYQPDNVRTVYEVRYEALQMIGLAYLLCYFPVSLRFMTSVTAVSATLGKSFSDGVSLLSC
jgi:hypothetical protein